MTVLFRTEVPSEWLTDLVRQYLTTSKPLYVATDIPEKQLKGARSSYAPFADDERALVLLDDSMMGSGKSGMVITNRGLWWRRGGSGESEFRFYSELPKVSPAIETWLNRGFELEDGLKLNIGGMLKDPVIGSLANFLNAAREGAQPWHLGKGEERLEPMPVFEIKRKIADGEIDPHVWKSWREGMGEWITIDRNPALFDGPPPLDADESVKPSLPVTGVEPAGVSGESPPEATTPSTSQPDTKPTEEGKSEEWRECLCESGTINAECPHCGQLKRWGVAQFKPGASGQPSDATPTGETLPWGRPIVGMAAAFGIAVVIGILIAGAVGEVAGWVPIVSAVIFLGIRPILVAALMPKFPIWETQCDGCGEGFLIASQGRQAFVSVAPAETGEPAPTD